LHLPIIRPRRRLHIVDWSSPTKPLLQFSLLSSPCGQDHVQKQSVLTCAHTALSHADLSPRHNHQKFYAPQAYLNCSVRVIERQSLQTCYSVDCSLWVALSFGSSQGVNKRLHSTNASCTACCIPYYRLLHSALRTCPHCAAGLCIPCSSLLHPPATLFSTPCYRSALS
jgi:hypothetical protein